MKDKRDNLKKHVRAAREWLGQAEHSLERKDDVKSELKIILAKAELQRAEETKKPRKFSPQGAAIKLLSVAFAAAAAFGVWSLPAYFEKPSADVYTPTINRNDNADTPLKNAQNFPAAGENRDDATGGNVPSSPPATTENEEANFIKEEPPVKEEQVETAATIAPKVESEQVHSDGGINEDKREHPPREPAAYNDTYTDNNTVYAMPKNTPQLPSEDMQELMKSAYFSLRKE